MDYKITVKSKDKKVYNIQPFFSVDSVHGDQRVAGNILFPHNIGLSCTHNPKNYYNVGYWAAHSMKRYGFNFAYAPTVAVSHNPQWGRFY